MEKQKIIESMTLSIRQEKELKEARQGEQSNYWVADVWRLDDKNLNGHVYTRALAERIVQEGQKTMCYDGHDADFVTGHDYAPAIGYCDNPRIEDNKLVVDVHFLESQQDSDSVRNIRELHKAGLPIGVSSVGYGSMDADGIIGEDYEVVRFLDFVSMPAGLVYADPKEEEVADVVDVEDKAEAEEPVTEVEAVAESSESEVSEETVTETEADTKEIQNMEITEERLAEEAKELQEAREIKENTKMFTEKNKYSEETVQWVKRFSEALAIGTTYTDMLPAEIASQVEMKINSYGRIASKCAKTIISGTYTFAAEDSAAVANWTAEGAQVTDSTPTAKPVKLTPKALVALVKISKEMAKDEKVMVDYVVNAIAKAIAKALDLAVLKGTGSTNGEPTGVLSGLATTQQVTGTAAGFTWAELKAAIGKIGEHRKGASIVCNQATLDHIYEFKDNGKYVFDQTQPLDRIWGMDVIISDLVDNYGTTGKFPVVIGNFGFYHLAQRSSVEIETLPEAFAANRQVGILGEIRVDGGFANGAAFAAIKNA